MIYTTPAPPTHAIGTAVVKTMYRGGHAVAVHPARKRGALVPAIYCRATYQSGHAKMRCSRIYLKPPVVG